MCQRANCRENLAIPTQTLQNPNKTALLASGILEAKEDGNGNGHADFMDYELFIAFSRTIGLIPAKAVLRAVELERWMIQDDLSCQRDVPLQDAASILSFSHFLKAVKAGEQIHPASLPPEHIPFYHDTVERLVEAHELPANSTEQFDHAFADDFLNVIAA